MFVVRELPMIYFYFPVYWMYPFDLALYLIKNVHIRSCLTYVTYISDLGTAPWLWNLTDCRKWPTDRTCPMMELSVLLNRFCCIQKPPSLSHAFHVSFFLRNRYSSLRKNHLSILLSSFHVIYACTITSAW
jgi:hypothetical protein